MSAEQEMVWVVLSGEGYTKVAREGVFSTEAGAREYVDAQGEWADFFTVERHVLDRPAGEGAERFRVDYGAIERDLRRVLETELSIRLCVLVGSMAHRDADWRSDIDLLVTLAPRPPLHLFAVASDLERELGRGVEVIELHHAAASNPCIVLDAIEVGRVLCDRDGQWPALVARADEFRRRCERHEREQAARFRESLRDLGIDPNGFGGGS